MFFSLTAATVGDLAPVLNGVTLPQARVGSPAHQELTLGVSSRPAAIVFNGRQLMSVSAAATATSNYPDQPLVVPQLYTALKTAELMAENFTTLASGILIGLTEGLQQGKRQGGGEKTPK